MKLTQAKIRELTEFHINRCQSRLDHAERTGSLLGIYRERQTLGIWQVIRRKGCDPKRLTIAEMVEVEHAAIEEEDLKMFGLI